MGISMRKTKKFVTKVTGIFMAFIFIFGLTNPMINVRAHFDQESLEIMFDDSILPLEQDIHFIETDIISSDIEPSITYSQARQNYNLLRTGNYSSAQVINRFHELFGYISSDYILQNYTLIFHITSEEMDEVILEILTCGAVARQQEITLTREPFLPTPMSGFLPQIIKGEKKA